MDIVKDLVEDGKLKEEMHYFLSRADAATLPVKTPAGSTWATAAAGIVVALFFARRLA